ncbi:hypothetical protein C7S16_2807 [Burkholderia thailandensis]|uniref:Uncharacterized protein n=1 Tax=Burkholderia thailandensis TaxID=57975 RepID=A0AAW9CSG2_BURTH|nr:hypothetical protein [Burkholderia thailandensis]MDW9253945.1 hypothetical protein [Burkholderia thailandensis]
MERGKEFEHENEAEEVGPAGVGVRSARDGPPGGGPYETIARA